MTDIDIETAARGHAACARRDHRSVASTIRTDHVVLAIGHSARDTFEMLHARGVFIEPKPFSIGVRIEHPQALVDTLPLRQRSPATPLLGAADYKLVHHAKNGRSRLLVLHVPGRHASWRRRRKRAASSPTA